MSDELEEPIATADVELLLGSTTLCQSTRHPLGRRPSAMFRVTLTWLDANRRSDWPVDVNLWCADCFWLAFPEGPAPVAHQAPADLDTTSPSSTDLGGRR